MNAIFRVLPERMHWLADRIIELFPEEAVRRTGYYDVGADGQPRGWLNDAYKSLRSGDFGTLTPLKKPPVAKKSKYSITLANSAFLC